MPKFIIQTVLCLLLVFPGSRLWGQTEKPAQQAIKDLIEKLDQALIDRDYEVLNTHYATDLKLIAPNGTVISREMALAPFKDAGRKSALRSISQEELQIRVGGNQAFAIMKTTHSFEDRADRVYRNLQVFNKVNGIWKLVVSSSVAISQ